MINDISDSTGGARHFDAQPIQSPLSKPHSTDEAFDLLRPTILRLSQAYGKGDIELTRDLFQVGAVGLLGAFERFNGDRGATFKTFAHRSIRGSMLNYLRDLPPMMESLDVLVAADEDGDCQDGTVAPRELEDKRMLAHFTQELEWLFIRESFDQVASELSDRQAQVLDMFASEGMSVTEIARSIGVSAPRVSALLRVALARIRERLRLS